MTGPGMHRDERGVYYVRDGQRYHYVWCHDCGGEGCDYCEGTGQVKVVDSPPFDITALPSTE